MSEISLYKVAIGAMVAVITTLLTVIAILYKKLITRDDQIISFAVKIIETGVPNETFEAVASWLKKFKNGNGKPESEKAPGR